MTTATLLRDRQSEETLLSDRHYRSRQILAPTPVNPITMEAESPLAIPFGDGVFIFEPAPEEWTLPVLHEVCKLSSLPANWNSYGAQPIRSDIAREAVTLLLNCLSPDDPVPSVVPTARGGILLEWHEGGIDLEVDIRSPRWIHIAFNDSEHEQEVDCADPELVEEFLNVLRSRIR